ncbi:AAA family ATPase, partial [Enterobacter hormaechei]|nr:AAA family ATPase [Enterobacter hormaechei]
NGDEQGLSDLLPFRYRGSNPDAVQPRVTGVDGLQNVMCFNEKYVDQFTFQPDELVSNSFDIFIKSEAYHETEREIEAMVVAIRQQ